MAEPWESHSAADREGGLASAPLSAWCWFAWWLLLGVLLVGAGIAFLARRNDLGAVCLILAGFGFAQTIGWRLTGWAEDGCLAALRRTRLGDPTLNVEQWSAGARWWRRWHLGAAAVAFVLLIVGVQPQNQPGGGVLLLTWLSVQLLIFIFFLMWMAGRRRLAAFAAAAQLMDFTLWPKVEARDFSQLSVWPDLSAKGVLLSHGLEGKLGGWSVFAFEAFFLKGEGPMAKKQQTLVAVSPTLNVDFLLTPRDDREKLNWLAMLFHLSHPAGWVMIAIELGTKLFKKKDDAPGLLEAPHGDRHFAKRYRLLGADHEFLLLLFHPGVRAALLPSQWMQPAWHVHQAGDRALLGRPGVRVEPAKMPEFLAECLKLIELLQEAEAEALALADGAAEATQ